MTSSSWIDSTLSGIYVLRGVDGATAEQVVQRAFADYRGPGFGGVDFMPPNARAEAWLILGRWTQCWEGDVQEAAARVLAALEAAADVVNAGITATAPGP